ncbi:MAG: triacylglycerol lipase [Flavobacteriales bacterium]|jgi:triacylglycerol lipase
MNNALTPNQAVRISIESYRIKNNNKLTRTALIRGLAGLVKFPTDTKTAPHMVFDGISGGIFVQKESGFGFVGYRDEKGFSDDLVFSLRGTDSFQDALTDAYFKTEQSSTGKSIHGGFAKCFNTIVNDIDLFLKNREPKGAIHCIGHSLGGALATLVADHLSNKYKGKEIYLYTLGSPRVGLKPFSTTFTDNLKPENIFRLNHTADPVTVVPPWPFIHVPANSAGIGMDRFGTGFQFRAHKSSEYLISVAKNNWDTLRANADKVASSDQIERWLESKQPATFTGKSMIMLSEAIYYVLKKARLHHLLNGAITAGSTAGYTLLDLLSIALSKGIDLGKNLGRWAIRLVVKIMEMLGKTVRKAKEHFSKDFIGSLLREMHRRVNIEVIKSLDSLKNSH